MTPIVYIGYDSREAVGSYVAAHSILQRTKSKPVIHLLKHRELRKSGLFCRPWLINGKSGEHQDLIDQKTFSTEFSHTRFLVPRLNNYNGWALFMDADMVVMSDIAKLFALCDPRYAVMVVKHQYPHDKEYTKMDSRKQRIYNRKNWSSFCLWNCAHPSNQRLTPEMVNTMDGADLHGFSWLNDGEIGALPFTYNFISGVSPKLNTPNSVPDVIHYSDGGPWFEECQDVPYAQVWIDEYEAWQEEGACKFYSEIPSIKYE